MQTDKLKIEHGSGNVFADLHGKETVRAAFEAMRDTVTNKLLIHSIITHGQEGAANGIIIIEQGGSFSFCNVYRFDSASGKKIKSMMSCVIDMNGRG